MAERQIILGGLDILSAVDTIRVGYGRRNAGSPKTDLQAGMCKLVLFNDNLFFTSGRGAFFLQPGTPLSVRLVSGNISRALVSNMRLITHRVFAVNEAIKIECEFMNTLYSLTSSNVSLTTISGKAQDVLRRLISLINPEIFLHTIPDSVLDDDIIIKADTAYEAIIILLQTYGGILIEGTEYGSLVYLPQPNRQASYMLYDMGGYENDDATFIG